MKINQKIVSLLVGALVVLFGATLSAAPFGSMDMEIENGQLQQRMWQIKENSDDEEWNAWGGVFSGKNRQDLGMGSNKFFPNVIKTNYTGVQAGADKKVGSDFRVGAFVGYTDYDSDFGNKNGIERGGSDTYSSYLGLYGVYKKPESEFYATGSVRVGSMKHDLNAVTEGRTQSTNVYMPVDDSDSATNWSVSLGAGQKFYMTDKEKTKEGFYLEPQASVLMGRVGATSFKTHTPNILMGNSAQVDAKLESKNVGYLNLGTLVGYEIKKGKSPINIYGKIGMVYDFGDEQEISGGVQFFRPNGAPASGVVTQGVETSMSNHWWVFGVGAVAQINERHSVHVDLETSVDGDTTKNWQIGAAYKYTW